MQTAEDCFNAILREQPKEKSRRKKPALAATDQDEPTGKGSSTKDDKPKLDKAKQKELSELEELLKAEGFDPDDLDLDLNSFVLEGLDDLDLDLVRPCYTPTSCSFCANEELRRSFRRLCNWHLQHMHINCRSCNRLRNR